MKKIITLLCAAFFACAAFAACGGESCATKTAQQTQQCGQKDCAGAAKQKQKKPECNAQSCDKLSKNKHNRQGGKLKNVERDTLH